MLSEKGTRQNYMHNSIPVLQKNVVVKNCPKGQVTYEIDGRLVGKYVVIDDPEMYFEIKPDGKEYKNARTAGSGNYQTHINSFALWQDHS